eukprot:107733_1
MYILFKMCLYYILVSRLWIMFSADKCSYMCYNRRKLQIWLTFIIFWEIVNLIWSNSTVSFIMAKNSVPECQIMVSLYCVGSVILLDNIAGMVNIILFARPLVKLYKLTYDYDLKVIIIKQCIFSIIAIVSTLIALVIVGVFNLYIFAISADIIISILSIMCMFQWNAWFTNKILCCCLPRKLPKSVENDITNL